MSTTIAPGAAGPGAPPAREQAAAASASRAGQAGGSAPRPGNHVIVVFGATGELARRKLLPGLFHLARAGLMPDRYQIIGVSPQDMTGEQFRDLARQAVADFGTVKSTGAGWQAFARRLSFASADPAHTHSLAGAIAAAERRIGGTPGRLFHLAIPPAAFVPTVTMLGAAGLAAGSLEGYERLLLDAMDGDQSLFTSDGTIERLWQISAPCWTTRHPSSRTDLAHGDRNLHSTAWPPPTTGTTVPPRAQAKSWADRTVRWNFGPVMAARLETPPAGVRPVAATARRTGPGWPRLPAAAELAAIGVAYAAYALVRLAIEPYLNHFTAARPLLAGAIGY